MCQKSKSNNVIDMSKASKKDIQILSDAILKISIILKNRGFDLKLRKAKNSEIVS